MNFTFVLLQGVMQNLRYRFGCRYWEGGKCSQSTQL